MKSDMDDLAMVARHMGVHVAIQVVGSSETEDRHYISDLVTMGLLRDILNFKKTNIDAAPCIQADVTANGELDCFKIKLTPVGPGGEVKGESRTGQVHVSESFKEKMAQYKASSAWPNFLRKLKFVFEYGLHANDLNNEEIESQIKRAVNRLARETGAKRPRWK